MGTTARKDGKNEKLLPLFGSLVIRDRVACRLTCPAIYVLIALVIPAVSCEKRRPSTKRAVALTLLPLLLSSLLFFVLPISLPNRID